MTITTARHEGFASAVRATLRTPKTPAPFMPYAHAAAAHDAADKAWQAALEAAYGKRAQDARYDERGKGSPLLAALYAAKKACADAESAAFDARPR